MYSVVVVVVVVSAATCISMQILIGHVFWIDGTAISLSGQYSTPDAIYLITRLQCASFTLYIS